MTRDILKEIYTRRKLVHKLEPKKRVFGSGGWAKLNIDI